ncbi:MAG: NADH-ubiquinone/plastoquinone oxidoreductase chain 6 [Nitrospirae bacterium]|nr:MAG: NADH-ubiquinone/plastoquinone oxidoreductase chain 6 [Nitrospirota bacterium]
MLPQLIFGYFAAVIVLLSLLVITRKNPVHSVMWMLLLFFHIAAMYLFLNAEFIAAIQVIVYAGAILVLFLFVVLLLNLKEELEADRFVGSWPVAVLVSGGIFLGLASVLRSFVIGRQGSFTVELIQKVTHTKTLGLIMYTEYLFPFEIASLILLIAVIGAIVLAKKRMRSH